MSFHNISVDSTSQTKALQSLLKVVEELLFSFALPPELVKKYQTMKGGVFRKLGIQDTQNYIWKLQKEAHSKLSPKKEAKVQVAENTQMEHLRFEELQQSANAVRWELLSRLTISHHITRCYQETCNYFLKSFFNLQAQLSSSESNLDPPRLNSISEEFKPTERVFSDSSELKEIEDSEERFLEVLKGDWHRSEVAFGGLVNSLNTYIASLERNVNDLQNHCREVSEKSAVDRKNLTNKISEVQESAAFGKQELTRQFKIEIENLKVANFEELKSSKADYEAQLKELKSENQSLLAQVQHLKEQSKFSTIESESNYNQLMEDFRNLKLDKNRLLQELKDHKAEHSEYEYKVKRMEEQIRSLRDKKESLERELEYKDNLLEDMKQKHRSEIESLRFKYTQDSTLVRQSLMGEAQNSKLDYQKRLQDAYQEIESFKQKLEQSQKAIDTLESENKETCKAPKTPYELAEAKKALKAVEVELSKIYLQHSPSQRDWNHAQKLNQIYYSGIQSYSEVVLYAMFAAKFLQKNMHDNRWLVDRLTELGKQLDIQQKLPKKPFQKGQLRSNSLSSKVWKDIKGSSEAVKDFENSRKKLIKHFEDSV